MTEHKEIARGTAETAGKAIDRTKKTKEELRGMKLQAIGQELKALQEDLKETDAKERKKKIWDRIKGIAVIAFFGRFMKKEDKEQMTADEKDVHVSNEVETEKPEREEVMRILLSEEEIEKSTESDEGKERPVIKEVDPSVMGEVDPNKEPVARKTSRAKKITEDHRHNLELIEIMPKMKSKLDRLMEKYEKNLARYERVAKATNIPTVLIAAIHFREGGMNFTTYLHNGQKLGKETTKVPNGILFHKEQWEEAAIHALGGTEITDANGKKSNGRRRGLIKRLGMDADTTDIATMLTYAEKYNGLGYRYKNLRSSYVYGGTNVVSRGAWIKDGPNGFRANFLSNRPGIAAFIMAAQAIDANREPRYAMSNTILADATYQRDKLGEDTHHHHDSKEVA